MSSTIRRIIATRSFDKCMRATHEGAITPHSGKVHILVNRKIHPPKFLQVAVAMGIVTRAQACRSFLSQQRHRHNSHADSPQEPIGQLLHKDGAITREQLKRVLTEIRESPGKYTDSADPVKLDSRPTRSLSLLLDIIALVIVVAVAVASRFDAQVVACVITIGTFASGLAHRHKLPAPAGLLNTRNIITTVLALFCGTIAYAVLNLYSAFSLLDTTNTIDAYSRVVRAAAAFAVVLLVIRIPFDSRA